jgi:hypothetical protein
VAALSVGVGLASYVVLLPTVIGSDPVTGLPSEPEGLGLSCLWGSIALVTFAASFLSSRPGGTRLGALLGMMAGITVCLGWVVLSLSRGTAPNALVHWSYPLLVAFASASGALGGWVRKRHSARVLTLLALGLVACTTHDEEKRPTEPCTAKNDDGEVPCGDFGNLLGTTEELFVHGRAVIEEPGFEAATTAPEHDLEQSEVPNLDLEVVLRADGKEVSLEGSTDDEGWLATRLDLRDHGLEPGNYALEVWAGNAFLSRVNARLLAPNYGERIVVSDIDLTYLDTDFQTAAAIAELLTQSADERAVLPGMPAVYRALRAGAETELDRPLVFLSGSPLFFRRVLDARTRLDELEHDGILLKPTNLLLTHELLVGLEDGELLSTLLGGDEWLGSLTDQLGYKLTALFAQQSNWPNGAQLLLLGDDSETDHVVYALFHRTMNGELNLDALLDQLDHLDVDDLWLDAIEELVPAVLPEPPASPVEAIFINQTDVPNTELPAEDWVVEGLTELHAGSEPLMEALTAGGWVL